MSYQIDQEKIEAWKKQHGDIFKITVENYSCILKKPSRKALSYGSSVAQTDPLKFNEVILKDCWLEGDQILLTDDTLFLSVCQKIGHLIEVKEAELVKL